MPLAAVSPGQVNTAITSSGLGTTVVAPPAGGTNYQITGGTRQGTNLFHSFGLFSVGEGDTASFRNTTPGVTTSNIVSRVTGDEPSNIFGTIDTLSYPGANLFLINPRGMVFGPNARLDVGGAFHAGTADYVRFADGAKLYAALRRNSVLTVAWPEAFGFLGPTPAPLSVQGSSLQVPKGQTLSLVGGDIAIQTSSSLSAPSGRIQIASVASPGQVVLSSPRQPADLNVTSFARLGRIDIAGSMIDTSGDPVRGDPGGTVLIRGGRLIVDGSNLLSFTWGNADGARLGIDLQAREAIVLANGAFAGAETLGNGRGGDVSVSARTVTLTGGSAIRSQGGPGPGGNITVTATASIDISGLDSIFDPSQIVTEIRGSKGIGNGGRITLAAPSVTLADGGSVFSNAFEGRGGDIVMEVGRLSVTGGGQIVTHANGDSAHGGSVTVMADAVALSGEGSGLLSINNCNLCAFIPGSLLPHGGDLLLNVGTLTLTGGAQIQSGAFFLDLKSGNVDIRARDSVVISDGGGISSRALSEKAAPVTISSPILSISNGFIDTSTVGPGDAGDVSVNAGKLTLTDGAQINSSSGTLASGRGGNIRVTASDSVSISGRSLTPVSDANNNTSSGLFSTAAGAGPGGSISITTGSVQLLDGATISASSSGTGLAGSVAIRATTFQSENSFITTAATGADGGDIDIRVGSLVYLRGSEITTSVGSGAGKGGNITIDPQSVVLNNSQIRADAFGGPGGNITIVADVFLSSESTVSASSALSAPGTISIDARITNLSDSLAQLPDNVLQAASLLRAACTARIAEGKASSLVVAGREGVPPEPEGLLWSPLGASLTDLSATPREAHERELLPRFAGVWLSSNCTR